MATLELYLIRHGVAAERGEEYPDDSKRPLTSDGIARLRKEAKALDALGVTFDLILSSPLVRAKQTADVFAEVMKSKPAVQTSDALTPAGGPAAVIQELGRHMRKERIALVGHEPNMGELAAHLIGSKVPVPFKKGAICRLDFSVLPPKGKGQIIWFVPPRFLRKLA
ncbi:MAG TPA: phosphohistidine phosphatase SixA [Vicinamibacterales bacterium]|nr:phosphohistidine phosphatase SixA [Vicinamibacterales bacterium]